MIYLPNLKKLKIKFHATSLRDKQYLKPYIPILSHQLDDFEFESGGYNKCSELFDFIEKHPTITKLKILSHFENFSKDESNILMKIAKALPFLEYVEMNKIFDFTVEQIDEFLNYCQFLKKIEFGDLSGNFEIFETHFGNDWNLEKDSYIIIITKK